MADLVEFAWIDERTLCPLCGVSVVNEGALDLQYDDELNRMVVVCWECLADVGVLPASVLPKMQIFPD